MYRTDWVKRNARYYPQKTAFHWVPTQERWTYAQCDVLGSRLAEWLHETYGVTKGDRVGILAENTMAHVWLFLAAQKAGYVLVPLNYRLAPAEVAYMVENSQPKVVFVQPSLAEYAVLWNCPAPETQEVEAHTTAWKHLPYQMSYAEPDPLPEDAPLMILFTSGTTGKPKGAIISHKMVTWNAINTAHRLDLTTGDVSFNAAPFYHTGGWNVLLAPFLLHGATTLLLDRFDPAQILSLIETERMTIIWGVPTMMAMLADHPNFEQTDLASVRYTIVGGEPMPIPLIQRYHEKGIAIRQGFGMTEVGPNCFSLPEEDAIRKAGSIGFPNFYIDTRIVNDAGEDVPTGEAGELWMRSPVVTPGYWRNPEATAQSITNGWFHTGDMMRVDEEGYFYVAGRKKDMYISGGENVYPAEVEKVLYSHPQIHEAAVVGVPDAKWGESGFAFVVIKSETNLTTQDVQDFCRKHLAKYKIPRHVQVVAELPKGHSGKIQKIDLTKIALDILQSETNP